MRQRGFTLIEIILSVLIVAVGFLAVARINPFSYRGAELSKDHLAALRVARNVIEQVRALPFGADPSSLKGDVTLSGEMVEGSTSNQTFKVENIQTSIPSATAGYGTVAVTVSWREGTATGSAGVQKTLVLTGGLSREP